MRVLAGFLVFAALALVVWVVVGRPSAPSAGHDRAIEGPPEVEGSVLSERPAVERSARTPPGREGLLVRVVERAGGSAGPGIPVAVVATGASGPEVTWHGETGPAGTVRIDAVELERRDDVALYASALVPAFEPVTRAIPRAPETELVLTLPARCDVVARVLAADGSPSRADGVVRMTQPTSARDLARIALLEAPFVPVDRSMRKAAGQESVTFRGVGAGTTISLGGHLDADGAVESETIAVPTNVDETVVELAVDPRATTFRARVLEDGELFGGRLMLRMLPDWRRGGGKTWRVRTDDDGWLEVHLRTVHDEPVRLWLAALTESDEPRDAVAVASPGVVRPASVVDLGDLVLAPVPPLATVNVVDDRGEPILDCRVRVLCEQRGRRITDDREVVVRREAPGVWKVFGEAGPHARRIDAWAAGHLSADAVPLVPGGEHTIRLERSCSIAGRLELPGFVDFRRLAIELHRGLAAEPVDRVEFYEFRDGVFRFDGLEAGRYRVEGRSLRTGEEIFAPRTVDVAPGDEAQLPPVDLVGRLRRLHVTLRDPSGATIDAKGTMRIHLPGGIAEVRFHAEHAPQAETLLPSLDVEIRAEGYEPLRTELTPERHEVTLLPVR